MSADRGVVVAQLATFRGLSGIEPPGKLDLISTLVGGYGGAADSTGAFTWDDPVVVRTRRPGLIDPGLDLRYGITSATNLNLTINPDFSQVEADVDQLEYNLRFPVFLEEKRSFFLEGFSFFATPVPLLYTRSIVDPIAGGKLSGREGRWAFGVLSAWDQLPLSSQLAEPARLSGFEDLSGKDAINTVVRISREFGAGSRVGLFVADKSLRDIERGTFDGRNDVAAADATLVLGKIYTLSAQLTGAFVDPVGDGDPFTGVLYSVAARRRDQNVTVDLQSQYISKGFRAETSPITRANVVLSSAKASYRHVTTSDLLPYLEPGVSFASAHEQESLDLLDYAVGPTFATRLGANAELSLFYRHGQETFVRRFAGIDLAGAMLLASPSRFLSLSAEVQAGNQINYNPDDLFLGDTLLGRFSASVRPTTRSELELRYTKSLLWRPGGERTANVDLYYGKLSLSFTMRLAVRLTSQLDTYDDTLRNSALISYLIYPGTEAYLGYQETNIVTDGTTALDRRVFLKLSYHLQP
jgi:hypothetical protein